MFPEAGPLCGHQIAMIRSQISFECKVFYLDNYLLKSFVYLFYSFWNRSILKKETTELCKDSQYCKQKKHLKKKILQKKR